MKWPTINFEESIMQISRFCTLLFAVAIITKGITGDDYMAGVISAFLT